MYLSNMKVVNVMNKELISETTIYNKNILSLIDTVDIIKNNNEHMLSWYLKSKDNVTDAQNYFKEACDIIELSEDSTNTELHKNIIDMFNNTCNYLDRIIPTEKIIKEMNSDQFAEYINLLSSGTNLLDQIISLPKLQKYTNKIEKMKPRLKYLNKKIDEFKKIGKNKKTEDQKSPSSKRQLLKKGLGFAAGFVTGAGMSCVPGVGYIRMGLAAAKVTTSAVNAWALKHPKGIVSKMMMNVNSKMSPKMSSMINKIKTGATGSIINSFINGLSVGYIAGNVFELATGQTITEFANSRLNEQNQNVETVSEIQNTTQTTTNVSEIVNHQPEETTTQIIEPPTEIIDNSTEIIDITPITEEITENIPNINQINPEDLYGQKLDVSSIKYGYGTSLDPLIGTDPVRLYTDLGHEVHIGNEKILSDGTRMWALFQDDGTGYAWFKADDVIDAISNIKEDAMTLKLIK